jgi:hypothetical protein
MEMRLKGMRRLMILNLALERHSSMIVALISIN